MIVLNKRNGKRVDAEGAIGILEKVRGLMFRRKPVSLLFDFFEDGTHPIHSLFVFHTFWAIYINSSGTVVDKFRVEPFGLAKRNRVPARYLLETQHGGYFDIGDEVKIDVRMEDY